MSLSGKAAIVSDPTEPQPGTVVNLRNADNTDVRMCRWRFSPPTGSKAKLGDTVATKTSFTPDIPGRYEVELQVNEGIVDAGQRSRTVVVVRGAAGLPERLRGAAAFVGLRELDEDGIGDELRGAADQIEALEQAMDEAIRLLNSALVSPENIERAEQVLRRARAS